MPFTAARLRLTKKQRSQLTGCLRRRSIAAAEVFRAKIILRLADGASYGEITQELKTTGATVAHWKQRFLQDGIAGLKTYHPGQPPSTLTPAIRAKVLAKTTEMPLDGSTHWSCRKLAQALQLSKTLVHRIWQEADVKPHRLERYMASDDPLFEQKATDIIGLYLHRHSTPLSSVWMKKPPSKRWTGWTHGCHCRQDGPSGTALNIIDTARFPCTRRWTPNPAK
jgi:transposase